jgi:multicomponent K+:H+ antiporter subunit D
MGAIGVMAARSLSQQASFAGIGSVGTMLLAFGMFTPESQAAGLYYLLHSTLAIAALFFFDRLGHCAASGCWRRI